MGGGNARHPECRTGDWLNTKNIAMWKNVLPFTVIFLLVTACANQTIRTATSTPTSHSSAVASFPQIVNTPSVFLEALVKGEIVLKNGCLRVNETGGDSVLLIW